MLDISPGCTHCLARHMSDQDMNSASTLTGCVWPFAATSREGVWRCGLVQRAVAVLLLGGILLLAPLAFASPADAGWTAGLYDAADFDDVTTRAQDISALTKVNCVSDSSPDWKVSHALRVVGIPAPLRDAHLPLIFIVTSRSRAPPAGHREGFPRPLLPVAVSRPFPVAAAISRLLSSSRLRAAHRATYAGAGSSVAGFHLISQWRGVRS